MLHESASLNYENRHQDNSRRLPWSRLSISSRKDQKEIGTIQSFFWLPLSQPIQCRASTNFSSRLFFFWITAGTKEVEKVLQIPRTPNIDFSRFPNKLMSLDDCHRISIKVVKIWTKQSPHMVLFTCPSSIELLFAFESAISSSSIKRK